MKSFEKYMRFNFNTLYFKARKKRFKIMIEALIVGPKL